MKTALKARLQINDLKPAHGHERLWHAVDEATGLNALVSIHSTARGPAAGGCRMFAYGSFEQAIADVERLSCGMTYKNAAADLPLGGGKSVIIGAPGKIKSPDLMRSFGAFVNALEGRYYTAEDVGISPQDLAYAAEQSDFVCGLDGGAFASGDPSPYTAQGVFNSMSVVRKHMTGSPDLKGVTVAVQGLGNVGMHLAGLLHDAGAKLIVTDLDAKQLDHARHNFGATVVAPTEITMQQADIYAPCAMGAALNVETVLQLRVGAVVGAANNQLATDDMGRMLKDRGILYAPDYLVNGGGVTNVAMEILKVSDPSFRQERIDGMGKTLAEVLLIAEQTNDLPHRIADRIMEERIGLS